MAAFRSWADLQPELLCCVGDRLDLKWYASARGACTAWRRALAPPSPAVLIAAPGSMWCPYAASLPTRRSFELTAVLKSVRCVGSSNGWIALSGKHFNGRTVFVLFHPIAAVEIVLPPLAQESRWVSKVVFSPNPTKEDFAAATICDINRIAYVTAGARRWAVMDPVRLACNDQLIDILYTDSGKVYCLTKCGDVHLLRLPERRRREPANPDEGGHSEPEFSLLQPHSPPAKVQGPSQPKFSFLRPHLPPAEVRSNQHFSNHDLRQLGFTRCRDVMVIQRRDQDPNTIAPCTERCLCSTSTCCRKRYNLYMAESQGSHMNPPATVEPLLSEANILFNPSNVFASPYDSVSAFTGAKNLVLCDGSLYQVWRNTSCTVTFQLLGGGQHRVLENEIFVLKYNPQLQPCWDVVKDLGGYSFFVGRNNAVSMYGEGVPGLKGNCVYWIGGRGRDQGMVFDMATGRSASCQAPGVGLALGHTQMTICWYFLSDIVSSRRSGGRRVDQTPVRAPSVLIQDLQE
ncbi:hypothetical protein PR202_gb01832 [Eleusine coracana subsp. coracana]|uniref:KIB1-4 beta-propeller domain-containing protein n=1 Tax=Eleusine coracana subsp. coracana TaxID=191504 RepID=A0AAV5DVE0_ELECO|nr:hypothetical protein QOZ80_5BG0414130 [Eleusine coracana subsp. coracana]GJN14953.1 hypothetical protein PR202_gb01832 [Eleusine coracana subsp. coracana]